MSAEPRIEMREVELTGREKRLLELLGEGRSKAQIAVTLCRTQSAIYARCRTLALKLGLQNTHVLTFYAVRRRVALDRSTLSAGGVPTARSRDTDYSASAVLIENPESPRNSQAGPSRQLFTVRGWHPQ